MAGISPMLKTEDISKEMEDKIKELYEKKVTVAEISRIFKVSDWHVKKITDPAFFENYRRNRKERRAPVRVTPKSSVSKFHQPIYDPVRDGVLYPQSFTAQVCGDPLPGRSALDQRNGGKRG